MWRRKQNHPTGVDNLKKAQVFPCGFDTTASG
jgi:hypothetical protein